MVSKYKKKRNIDWCWHVSEWHVVRMVRDMNQSNSPWWWFILTWPVMQLVVASWSRLITCEDSYANRVKLVVQGTIMGSTTEWVRSVINCMSNVSTCMYTKVYYGQCSTREHSMSERERELVRVSRANWITKRVTFVWIEREFTAKLTKLIYATWSTPV